MNKLRPEVWKRTGKYFINISNDNYVGTVLELSCILWDDIIHSVVRSAEFSDLGNKIARFYTKTTHRPSFNSYDISSRKELIDFYNRELLQFGTPIVQRSKTISTKNLHGYICGYENIENKIAVMIELSATKDLERRSERFKKFALNYAELISNSSDLKIKEYISKPWIAPIKDYNPDIRINNYVRFSIEDDN